MVRYILVLAALLWSAKLLANDNEKSMDNAPASSGKTGVYQQIVSTSTLTISPADGSKRRRHKKNRTVR